MNLIPIPVSYPKPVKSKPAAKPSEPRHNFFSTKPMVRFEGHGNQKPPQKNWLKTVLTLGLLTSGAHAANFTDSGKHSADTTALSSTAGSAPFLTPTPPPGLADNFHQPKLSNPLFQPVQNPFQAGKVYKTGDYLNSPEEAIRLAQKKEIAEAPDAIKLITGPNHEMMYYELRLKNGAVVGLESFEDELRHEKFIEALKQEGQIKVQQAPPQQSVLWNMTMRVAMEIAPILVLTALAGIMRRMSGNDPTTIGQAPKNKKTPNEAPVTFKDVRGYPEVIRELKRVKERYLLGNLQRGHSKIKVKPIKGLLLEGPPGTGKSMMAKALATESKVPFHYVSGSQFVEMFVGVGAARVRSLFAKAKQDADKFGGAIIFIDELDSIGGKRETHGMGSGNDERVNALNELLQQMSGFGDDPRIMVLAATNRADHLDDALKRSGRFDKIVQVDLPRDKEQRLDILDKYLSEHPTAQNLDRDAMAEFTQGKSGADLANLVNQMAEAAVDRISEAGQNPEKRHLLDNPEFHKLNTRDFMNAMRNMEMGIKREARGTEDERKTVAVHEIVGHGLLARAAKTGLHIVSMEPRGDALGHVITDPRASSRKLPTLESMLKDLTISMGGRASERELLGAERITPGASGDIAQSKARIRQMLMTRMLSQASGADYDHPGVSLNDQDRQLVDSLLKDAENTAAEVINKVPREKLWGLVDKAMNLSEELEGDEANAFYQDVINTVGADALYQPIQQFIQRTAKPQQN